MAYVAGYFTANDLFERDFQLNRGGQWTKGKSCDTLGPIGPWLVTSDAVPNPQNLALKLLVNGSVMQSSSTAQMVFGVKAIVSHLRQFMTCFRATSYRPGRRTASASAASLRSSSRPATG